MGVIADDLATRDTTAALKVLSNSKVTHNSAATKCIDTEEDMVCLKHVSQEIGSY